MRARRETGVWLGKLWRSDEHILASRGKIVRSKEIRPLPEDETWSREAIEAIKATPWNLDPNTNEPGGVIPIVVRADHVPETDQTWRTAPKAVKVERSDLREFGYTKDCKKCEKLRRGEQDQVSRGHSEACGRRIVQELRTGNTKQRKRVEQEENTHLMVKMKQHSRNSFGPRESIARKVKKRSKRS